jgi:hypothetical protein
MAKRLIDLAAIEKQGRAAMSRLGISPDDLPESYRRPEVYRMVAAGMAKDLPRADQAYMRDRGAVERWGSAAALAAKAAELYWNPTVRALAGNDEGTMKWFWEHPDHAFKQLAAHAVEHPAAYRSGPLAEVMTALGEFQSFEETHGSDSEPTSITAVQTQADRPVSSGAGDQHAPSRPPAERAPSSRTAPTQRPREPSSYQELIAAKTLTPRQHERLQELARARFPSDEAPAPRPAPEVSHGSYEALVKKGSLSPAEWTRLTALAQQRHPEEDDPFGELPDSYFGEETTPHE